jgi:subtilisin family serine protease
MPEPGNILDALVHSVSAERLLKDPMATGEGVRIAVIDTGIERTVLEDQARRRPHDLVPIEGGIFSPGQPEPAPYTGRQSSPHGTTVADIILTLAPRARLYSADVFGSRAGSDVESVIHAIAWSVHTWQCKIINLSLGVSESQLAALPRRQRLQRAIEDAYYHDVIVFAAAHNDHPLEQSYPAAFAPPLLSVDKGNFLDAYQFAYELNHGIEFQAHARGYLGPFANEPATSWAAPHLAGLVARLLSLRPGLKPFEVKTLLYWMFSGGNSRPATGAPREPYKE